MIRSMAGVGLACGKPCHPYTRGASSWAQVQPQDQGRLSPPPPGLDTSPLCPPPAFPDLPWPCPGS